MFRIKPETFPSSSGLPSFKFPQVEENKKVHVRTEIAFYLWKANPIFTFSQSLSEPNNKKILISILKIFRFNHRTNLSLIFEANRHGVLLSELSSLLRNFRLTLLTAELFKEFEAKSLESHSTSKHLGPAIL